MAKKKHWFTLVEVMIVVLIVSTTFIGIITWIISTTNYLTETRQKVIAINLAKEGVEIMYNIRNTNWRRREDQRDACWLKKDPNINAAWSTCSWDAWITSWRRSILQNWWYYTLNRQADWWDLASEKKLTEDIKAFSDELAGWTFLKEEYALHMTGWKRYNYWEEPSWHETGAWMFYRYIAVDWLYKKGTSTNEKMDCQNWASGECWSWGVAKELRFCSVVMYTRPKVWRIQICSIMTNFEE